MDDRSKSTAKWGAACASCASAKAKCIRTNEHPSAKCDRCERLFKECTGQVHRPRKKRASKPSKTAQLEERLNGLVDLLRASGELSTTQSAEASSYTRASTTPSVPREHVSEASSGPSPQDDRREPTLRLTQPVIPTTYNSFAPPTCICRPEAGEVVTVAVDSDDELLDKYRNHMYPLFPFVVILPSTTATQLSATRPFLMLAIRTVASVDNPRYMHGQMYQLISHVSDYMLLRSERSIDLVLGLLVVLGWYHNHCMMHAQLNNLLHLAISLMADLGISRPPRLAERTQLLVLHPNEPGPRTNEERRALLGVWYLSSCIGLGFLKVEPMRFTSYIRQCLQELEDAKEYPSDTLAVAHVRLQHLSEKIAAVNNPEDPMDDIPGIKRAPLAAYQLALQTELDRLCNSFPAAVRMDKYIANLIATAKLRLYEPPLIDASLLRQFTSDYTTRSPTHSNVLDVLYRAHETLTGWFDQFLSIPVGSYLWLSISTCVHIIYAITMLSRWARLMGPRKNTTADGRDANVFAPTVITPHISGINVKDPSSRLVPGQGAPASIFPPITAATSSTSAGQPVPSLPESKDITRDPKLKEALSQLRDSLRQQPNLHIDMHAILNTLGDRFEKINMELRTVGAAKFGDSVGRGINVWDLTSRKVAIMRAKLARYVDSGSAISTATVSVVPGPSEARLQRQPNEAADQARVQPPTNNYHVQPGFSADTNMGVNVTRTDVMPGNEVAPAPYYLESWDCNSPWSNEMFDNLDAGLWLDNMEWISTVPS